MLLRKIHAAVAAMSLSFALTACGPMPDDAQSLPESSTAEVAQKPNQLPSKACVTTFYDAPNGNVVGMCSIACSGGAHCWGIQTNYHDQACERCIGPRPE